MRRHVHVCQSVEGALKLYKPRDWKMIAKKNKCSVEDVKDFFWNCLREGKLVIPIGSPCEGFDYSKGCPGHETT